MTTDRSETWRERCLAAEAKVAELEKSGLAYKNGAWMIEDDLMFHSLHHDFTKRKEQVAVLGQERDRLREALEFIRDGEPFVEEDSVVVSTMMRRAKDALATHSSEAT